MNAAAFGGRMGKDWLMVLDLFLSLVVAVASFHLFVRHFMAQKKRFALGFRGT